MKITIRSSVLEDCEKIRPLQKEITDLHHNSCPDLLKTEPKFFTPEAFLELLNKPDYFTYIAESEAGEVVGYAFVKIDRVRNHPVFIDFDRFCIEDICVLIKHRRTGIGRMLFERCKATAQEKNCRSIELSVWCFNTEAIVFYKSMGLQERYMRMELKLNSES
ncbi:MAG TPA: GNAT family N-acetyltransferase [Oscillospiraceae bacterium]|nr:GNAT family N-acetyltransferase [Oscillospiraceae bacterium]HPS35703.1 GNAT family N-acetyltransferase [Oscillospiraceae bacterium]